jgi:predicted nucleic acid-binding protein
MGPSPVVRLDDALRGVATLGFDTPPIIYFIEQHPVFGPIALDLFQRIVSGGIEGCTSVITLTETLTYPMRTQDTAQVTAYRTLLLRTPHFLTIRATNEVAERAADLRARYNLRTPDAIQIATALEAGCDAFITNDLALRRVSELRVLTISTLVL